MRHLVVALAALLALAAPASAQKRIALSFDDVPRQTGAYFTVEERTERLIAALRRTRVRQAAFFVTTGHFDAPWGVGGEARIAAYVAAGHVLANHSHGHFALSRVGPDAYLADLDRAAAWLHGRRGARPWFRFPYLDEGGRIPAWRDAVRAGLAQRGLANGYVTVDSYDWYLDSLLTQAVRTGLAIDRDALRALYIEIILDAANFQDALARATLGRSPAHVILLHETDLAALFIADAVAALRADGWRIVPVDRAYRDPIAREAPDTSYLGGGRIAAIAAARGRPPRELVPPLNEEATIARLFNERVLHQRVTP